ELTGDLLFSSCMTISPYTGHSGARAQRGSPESIIRSCGVWIPGSRASPAPRNDTSSTEQVGLEVRALDHAVTRLLHHPAHARDVDTNEVAAPLLHLAGDEDAVDIARVHQVDDDARHIVERPDVEPVGAEQDDVGFLAGRERADLVLEMAAARA